MKNNVMYWSSSPDLFFVIVAVIAAGLGVYGLYIIAGLIKSPNYESREFQLERFMMGMFNIVLSMLAIYTIVIITQVNAGEIFTQTNKLLGQLK